ncbi:hypothetical protein [Pseudomonas typographi]|uniref:hypothetical protein n=1 Tax=Pseudomonas typographi TaxID=2715964 RepID=UPI0016883904|nr:hypothetical protein [Pseudomonas typographi]MBD1554776.1 hypothetical protein [Pseudomonas typographi]
MKGAVAIDDQKWKVEQDLRTLAEAEEIKKDSKRMAAVKALAKQKIADMQQIAK